ncbi:hypothetical protein [Burkholderia vietnamiensis]|uniref:hypothetical protein n=1 Tax=Burkholderia vietnamiensis TaxID=60552 RepID=UPI0015933F01|nr:hypothetical protein [Burkholderia vietnamiensis]MCA8270696.1 hypothetical protein [Burkholderia vietnamiensis]
MMQDISTLEHASDAEEARFWTVFEAEIDRDDGAEARAHLDAGRAIFVSDASYPGYVVRCNPDGSRDLMTFSLESCSLQKVRSL